jgi:hypothetical protein
MIKSVQPLVQAFDGEETSMGKKSKKLAKGWVDLCVTFGDEGLSVPPIPKDHRERLIACGKWFWSTRPDIDTLTMYRFLYAKEIFDRPGR